MYRRWISKEAFVDFFRYILQCQLKDLSLDDIVAFHWKGLTLGRYSRGIKIFNLEVIWFRVCFYCTAPSSDVLCHKSGLFKVLCVDLITRETVWKLVVCLCVCAYKCVCLCVYSCDVVFVFPINHLYYRCWFDLSTLPSVLTKGTDIINTRHE